MKKLHLIRSLPDVLVIICCITSFGLSIIESKLVTDAHDWGLLYANALDLSEGLIPYKEIFIQYGILTTILQSLSLEILGNSVVSIGIITGIFYGINLFLSYCLWQKIMSKWLSFLATLIMFLIHAYITYPWANYFSYTFQLLSLMFLMGSPQIKNRYLIAGLFQGLSILARQSIFNLPPFYLYFFFKYCLINKDLRSNKILIRNIVKFHIGLLSVIAIFLLYLLRESALNDWILQSFTITEVYKNILGSPKKLLTNFLWQLIAGGFPNGWRLPFEGRNLLYTMAFLNEIIIYIIVGIKIVNQKIGKRDELLFLYSSVALFGYLQAFHMYNLFRLQSSSSLGIGLLIFSLYQISSLFNEKKKLIFSIPAACIIIYLSATVLFTKTNAVYFPWNKDVLLSDKINQLKAPSGIRMLSGVLYETDVRTYYESLVKSSNTYTCQLQYLVNFTINSYIPLMLENFKRVQRSPIYNEELSNVIFKDEKYKIDKLIIEERAIIIAEKQDQIPKNYQIVLKIKVPESIPWVGRVTYVAVPKFLSHC